MGFGMVIELLNKEFSRRIMKKYEYYLKFNFLENKIL